MKHFFIFCFVFFVVVDTITDVPHFSPLAHSTQLQIPPQPPHLVVCVQGYAHMHMCSRQFVDT